jgi:hypothetical protein
MGLNMDTYITTRKLTMNQIVQVGEWIKEHAMGAVRIRGALPDTFIQQYCAEHDGNKKIHKLKVQFFNETDARRFLMSWG